MAIAFSTIEESIVLNWVLGPVVEVYVVLYAVAQFRNLLSWSNNYSCN